MDPFVVQPLFKPLALGGLALRNRIVMAPMTRLRSDAEGVPAPYMQRYYAQRAAAGLIVTESIAVAPYGAGYPNLPGLFDPRQIAAWHQITRSVHAAGGRIAAQLWHVGRPRTEAEGQGRQPGWAAASGVLPHELSRHDIASMIDGFASGAEAARLAGFDAVEIHGGNGFLLDRMLRSATNHRDDRYGGSLENRSALLLEISEAVASSIPANRVGIRLSPSATVNGRLDPEAETIFAGLLDRLSSHELAYVHVTRTTSDDRRHGSGPGLGLEWLRGHYAGAMIGAGEIGRDEGAGLISKGTVDAVAFGRLFLANPDLPNRIRLNASFNRPDAETFYTAGEAGLTDYPALDG